MLGALIETAPAVSELDAVQALVDDREGTDEGLRPRTGLPPVPKLIDEAEGCEGHLLPIAAGPILHHACQCALSRDCSHVTHLGTVQWHALMPIEAAIQTLIEVSTLPGTKQIVVRGLRRARVFPRGYKL